MAMKMRKGPSPSEDGLSRLGPATRRRLVRRTSGHPTTTWALRRELGLPRPHGRAGRFGRKGSTPVASDPGGVASADLIGKLQAELRLERAEILEPLLHRFSQLGERMRSGAHVPPEVVEEGLRLLDDYVRQLHEVHIREFAEAGLDMDHSDVCYLPMAQIEGEPERAERRVATVRALLSGYRARLHGYDRLLGLELRNESIAELSWEGYAEDYARTCVPSHISAAAAEKWRSLMQASEQEFARLRLAVQDYLVRTHPFVVARALP